MEANESSEEKELRKLQKLQVSTAHLSLKAMEGFVGAYENLKSFINYWVGRPAEPNPEYDKEKGESDSNKEYVWSQQQTQMYDDGLKLLREFQVDVAEPVANISRISTAAFTGTLGKRHEKVLDKIKKTNPSAATAITRIAPSASHMFGGDHKKLENVVSLNKDLISSSKDERSSLKKSKARTSSGYQGHSSSYHSHGGRGGGKGRGGYGYSHGKHSYGKKDSSVKKKEGNSSREGKDKK